MKKMKKIMQTAIAMLVFSAFMGGCTSAKSTSTTSGSGASSAQSGSFRQVSAEEAKKIMDTEKGYLILDVRTQEEYDEKHIPDAVLIPVDELANRAEKELTDKNQLILVYCRSGNRSKKAAQILADLGYTNVVDFGGINSWPYETE
jgi:rhodanese-related sulfurtransferase